MITTRVSLDSHDAVAETLLISLYARALELRQPEPLLHDEAAGALVERLDYDFGRFRLSALDQTTIALRARQFDHRARDFLSRRRAPVVHIGCGLDTRFERVDDGRVIWYDLDLPEVIALRRELLAERPRCHTLAGSILDSGWMDAVPDVPPPLFLAEGVLPYFEEAQVKGLVRLLRERFPGAELVCDAMTPLMVRLDNLKLLLDYRLGARLHWGLERSRDPEGWAPGIRLIDEWYYFDEPEPRLSFAQWMRYFPPFGRGVGVFHYRLGLETERSK